MSTLVIPYTFTAGTDIISSQVNANFSAIVSVINGNIDSTNISSVNAVQVNAGSFASGTYTFPGNLTVTGTFTPSGGLPASTITAGTFGSGNFVFPGNLTVNGDVALDGDVALENPLPVASGGTGTTTPSLVEGTNVTISGDWPNQTISASASSSGTVTLAIALGFVAGTVTTEADLPAQPIVGYTSAQLTKLWLNCKTADTTTVFTVYKNGTSIGTITNTTSQPVSKTITTVSVSAGDVLSAACTTAGTAADCALVVEGTQAVS